MLREKFGWPPPDFSSLRSLGSASEKDLKGQPAPPLRIAGWLNSGADRSRRGKVVLVEFGDFRRRVRASVSAPRIAGPVRGLSPGRPGNRLDPLAGDRCRGGPAGRPGLPAALSRRHRRGPARLIRGHGRRPSPSGAGSAASRSVPTGRSTRSASLPLTAAGIVETIVPLLKEAGARDVKLVSLDRPAPEERGVPRRPAILVGRREGGPRRQPGGEDRGADRQRRPQSDRRCERPGDARVQDDDDNPTGGVLLDPVHRRGTATPPRPTPTAASSFPASARAGMS